MEAPIRKQELLVFQSPPADLPLRVYWGHSWLFSDRSDRVASLALAPLRHSRETRLQTNTPRFPPKKNPQEDSPSFSLSPPNTSKLNNSTCVLKEEPRLTSGRTALPRGERAEDHRRSRPGATSRTSGELSSPLWHSSFLCLVQLLRSFRLC